MDEKKGARDISDLKARLGLKKGPATGASQSAVPAPEGGASATSSSTGAVPSPMQSGIPAPLGFPAPPGARVAEPEPELPPQPPPPDPRRDPFAVSQPMMPPQGYYAPMGIPGIDDGTPAEPMSKPKAWGPIVGIAGGALVVVIAGFAFGRIYASRVNFNMTIDQTTQIRDEVEKMGRNISAINEKIITSPKTAKGEPDPDLAIELGNSGLKPPERDKIFHTNYFFLEDLAIDRLFTYYNDTILLYDLIAKNSKKTEADKESIESYVRTGGAGKADKNYGVTLDVSGPIPLAHFVEMGAPVCNEPGKTDCNANELKGFKYRIDSGAPWSEKPIKGKPGETVTPIQQNAFFKAIASGSADLLAVKDHLRRMAEIRGLSAKLANEQKELLADLKRAAERPKVFTF